MTSFIDLGLEFSFLLLVDDLSQVKKKTKKQIHMHTHSHTHHPTHTHTHVREVMHLNSFQRT